MSRNNILILISIAGACISCDKAQREERIPISKDVGSCLTEEVPGAPRRAFPIVISSLRDGGSRKVECFAPNGELIETAYFAKSKNPEINGKLFKSSEFSGSNEFRVIDAEVLFSTWGKLLTCYYGEEKLKSIIKNGRVIERDFYEKLEDGRPIPNEDEIRNSIDTFYLIVEMESYREKREGRDSE